jgi:hypothetical protein
MEMGGSKLFIPEIVILEVKSLFKKRITQHTQSVRELNNLLSGINEKVALRDADTMIKLYKEAFNKRLKALAAETPTYKDIPQEDIACRALSQRKPFTESGKGYKDTLIWETILRKIADPKGKTIFITKNHKDFASEKDNKQLHPHLLDDLKAKQLPIDSVYLYTDMKSFVDENILAYLKQIEELKTGKYKSFSIQEWFTDNRDDIISSANRYVENLLSDSELEDPTIRYIEDPKEISVDDVRLTDENTVYIDVAVISDAVIEVFVFKSSYGFVRERCPIEVLEYDWNEHYIWGQLVLELPISLSISFDLKKEKVQEFEVNPFSEIFGFCRRCGAAILSDAAETCGKCGKSLLYSGNLD